MKYILFIISVWISSVSLACDGCSLYDYANVQNTSYAGVFYRYRFYNGFNALGHSNTFKVPMRVSHAGVQDKNIYIENEKDYEQFQTIDFRFNYLIKNRWNLMINAPYLINTAYYNQVLPVIGPIKDSLTKTKGVGDILVSADRIFQIDKQSWKHQIKIGAGAMLPTGRFQLTDEKGNSLSARMQPGKGATEYLFRVNYILTFKKRSGVFLSFVKMISSKPKGTTDVYFNGASTISKKLEYRFGDRTNIMVNVYHSLGQRAFRWIPLAGMYFERVAPDRINRFVYKNTGGDYLFANVGFDVNRGSVTIQSMYQIPVFQSMEGTQLGNAGRFTLGVIYSINKKI